MQGVLTQSLRLRLAAFFVLYFSQGLPMGFFGLVVATWLAANGGVAADVAFVGSITTLPWALKLFLGFFIDRYAFLPMGRRKIWIVCAQSFVVVVLLCGAILAPTPDQIYLIAALGFTINVGTSAHDVAIDGMAVDILPEEDRPRASAWMFGGQALGAACAAVIGGMLITNWGIAPVFLTIALWFAGAWAFMVSVREREGERLMPWLEGELHPANAKHEEVIWFDVLKSAFKALVAPASLIFLIVSLINGYHKGIFQGAGPLIAVEYLGWEPDRMGMLAGVVTIIAALLGMGLGGRLGDRFGPTWCLLGVLIAFVSIDVMAVSGVIDWRSEPAVIAFAIAWAACDVLMLIFLVAVAMSLCDIRVSAVQFAVYMATANLGLVIGSASVRLADWVGGSPMLFSLTLVSHLLGLGLLLVFMRVRAHRGSESAQATA